MHALSSLLVVNRDIATFTAPFEDCSLERDGRGHSPGCRIVDQMHPGLSSHEWLALTRMMHLGAAGSFLRRKVSRLLGPMHLLLNYKYLGISAGVTAIL